MEDLRTLMIQTLNNRLQQEPAVLAVWLEGADATGTVDEFSDIDLCCSVADGQLDAVRAVAQSSLETLGGLDLVSPLDSRNAIHSHTVFHIKDTPPYLLLDFVIFPTGHEVRFISGDEIEKPLVLFDRGNVIQYRMLDEEAIRKERLSRLKALRETVSQVSRIDKYVKRGDFLEAYGYYQKWLFTPLVEILRLKYTPLHADYYIVHISRHLPEDVLKKLENLMQFTSIKELAEKSELAARLFKDTLSELEATI